MARARVIRSHEYVRMPWKNGGGETAEIVVVPAGATLAQFDWRISMARVAADGPFSSFPGVDRTLAVLAGGGLRLSVHGHSPVDLRCDSLPVAFPADVDTHATLLGGEILDFNVMTRRGRHEHSVRRLLLPAGTHEMPLPPANLVFCQAGALDVHDGNRQEHLQRHDSLLRDAEAGAWQVSSQDGATLLIVSIEEA